jgi:hypothetical protein
MEQQRHEISGEGALKYGGPRAYQGNAKVVDGPPRELAGETQELVRHELA